MRNRPACVTVQHPAAADDHRHPWPLGLLVQALILILLATACGNGERAGGGAPDAVVQAGLRLVHGSMPEAVELSIAALPDHAMSAADRANGVVDGCTVHWRGLDRGADGRAADTQGSFSLRRLGSGAWHLSDGYRQTLLNADGTIATTGEDLSGVYAGRTEAHGYEGIEMELRRNATSQSGSFRYRYFGTPRDVRIVALHRLVARDPYVRELDGTVQVWVHEGESGADTSVLPADAAALRPGGVAFRWIPPREPVVVILRRR